MTGATVTLTNHATGLSRTVQTDSQGAYQFLEVPPATYVITVTAPGFATTKQENVVLQVSSPATLNETGHNGLKAIAHLQVRVAEKASAKYLDGPAVPTRHRSR